MNENNAAEYVEWAMAIIRRWRDKGMELSYYSIANEPAGIAGPAGNPEYLRTILPKYTSISAELAAKITLPDITTDLTAADYNVWQEAALKYGLIKKKVDLTELDAGLNK